MNEHPGFAERISRVEYDNPVPVTFGVLIPLALLAFAGGFDWLGVTFLVMIPLRIWGLRDGGIIRRRYQKKFGWD